MTKIDKQTVFRRLELGESPAEIAARFSCSKGHIHNLKTEFIRYGYLGKWESNDQNFVSPLDRVTLSEFLTNAEGGMSNEQLRHIYRITEEQVLGLRLIFSPRRRIHRFMLQ